MKRKLERLNALKQERAAKVEAQGSIIKLKDQENRDFSIEEKTKFNEYDKEIREMDTQISDLQSEIDAEKRAATIAGERSSNQEQKEVKKLQGVFSLQRALDKAKRGVALDGAEKEAHDLGVHQMRQAGLQPSSNAIVVPIEFLRASDETSTAQTVTEDDGEYGGALVGSEAPRFIENLLPDIPFEALGLNVLTGLVGNYPLVSGEDYEFGWYEETEEVAAQKAKFSAKHLKPKRLAAVVQISNQLLIQTSGNAQSIIMRKIRAAQRKALVETILNGAGTMSSPSGDNMLEPTGILNLSNVLPGTVTGLPTWAAIVELETLLAGSNVDPQSLAYVLSSKIAGVMKTVKLDAGSGRFLLQGDTLNGYPYETTPLLPTLDDGSGGDVEAMIFGDWSQAYLGFWGGAEFVIDPYTKSSSNMTQVVINTHADFGVAKEDAFAINKKLTIT